MIRLMIITTVMMVGICSFMISDVQAKENVKNIKIAEVTGIYEQMPPEQKRDVNAQAKEIQKKLEEMSRKDKKQMEKQIRNMAKDLGLTDFDVSGLK